MTITLPDSEVLETLAVWFVEVEDMPALAKRLREIAAYLKGIEDAAYPYDA